MTYSLTRFGIYDELKKRLTLPGEATLPAWKMALAASVAGGIGGIAGNPADVVLVRMTADAAKPAEQRLGYKHWSVSFPPPSAESLQFVWNEYLVNCDSPLRSQLRRCLPHCSRGRRGFSLPRGWTERRPSDSHERFAARDVSLSVTRQSTQDVNSFLCSRDCRSYDVFKNAILSFDLMKDGLGLHFTSSFLAVRLSRRDSLLSGLS